MIFGLLIFIFFAIYALFNKYNAVYYLPTYLLLNAIGDIFAFENELIKWLKYFIILFVLFRTLNFRVIKKYSSVFFFLFYLMILVMINSNDFFYSLKNYLILFFTFLIIPVSEILMSKSFSEKIFLKNLTFMMILMPIYLILAEFFGGDDLKNSYSEDFSGGILSTTAANLFPLVIISSAFYLLKTKILVRTHKFIMISLVCVSIVSLIIIFRRTPIFILILSFLIFAYYYKLSSIFKNILFFIIFSFVIFSNSSLKDKFDSQLAARERIRTFDNYAKEGRVLEAVLVYDYIQNDVSLLNLFFGSDALSTRSFGEKKMGGLRTIHGDILSLLVSIGLFGVLLFFYVIYKHLIKTIPTGDEKAIYISILITFLITLITGRFITSLTFSLPIFLFLRFFMVRSQKLI